MSEKVKNLWFELVTGNDEIFGDRMEYDIEDLEKAYELTGLEAAELFEMFRTYEKCKCPICEKHIDDCLC